MFPIEAKPSYEDDDSKTVQFHVSSCEESYVETDLEDDDLQFSNLVIDLVDDPQNYYINQCKLCGVVPCSKYIRNIFNEELDLSHYGLGSQGIIPLSKSLVENKTITKINLADNYICDHGIEPFISMLRSNMMITDLNLSWNKLTSSYANVLTEALSNNPELVTLDLSNNCFDDKSADSFGELMKLSLNLKYLNLSNNRFHKDALVAFGKAFLQTTTIIELNLSYNMLGSLENQHINKFINGLAKNGCIKVLDLSSNSFSSSYALFCFGKLLKINTTIVELNLNNNRINTEACVKLAKHLPMCKSIQILRLGLNPILSAGAYSIVNFCLKHPNPTFKLLDFESVEVNEDFVELMNKLIETIPDIIVTTGVRLIDRLTSNVNPIYRLKLFSKKNDIRMLDFFMQYRKENDKFIYLDDIPNILNDFCGKFNFQLLEPDKKIVFKTFPRNHERTVDASMLCEIFDEMDLKEQVRKSTNQR